MSVTFLNEPKLILLHTIKWFQVLLCITNNSIKHHLFLYSQLNDQTVLFLRIQFSLSFICTQFKCQTVLFDPKIRPFQALPLRDNVDQGAIIMKGYAAFPKLQYYWSLTIWFFNVISGYSEGWGLTHLQI